MYMAGNPSLWLHKLTWLVTVVVLFMPALTISVEECDVGVLLPTVLVISTRVLRTIRSIFIW